MSPPRSLRGIALLTTAAVRSFAVLLRWRPRVAIATGGYVCAPVILSSWLLRIPVVVFLPDVVPGKAVRWLAPLARKIAVATDGSLPYLPRRKTVVTGYPVRDGFITASCRNGRKRFELPQQARVLCVFGGSQGSRALNEATATALPELLERYWILHVCGERRFPEAEAAAASIPAEKRLNYRLYSYLHDEDMAHALAAADLALCRSGASVLGELPVTGTPAILVPLPDAGVHQAENAAYLAEAGAAVMVENDLLPDRLIDLVDAILGNVERTTEMSAACRRLARPDAADNIAGIVRDLVA